MNGRICMVAFTKIGSRATTLWEEKNEVNVDKVILRCLRDIQGFRGGQRGHPDGISLSRSILQEEGLSLSNEYAEVSPQVIVKSSKGW